MKIDADVTRIAKRFGVDAALIQAVIKAEGNIVRAVQCSIPSVKTREQAIEITCRSAVHAMSDYVKANAGPEYVAFWGERWAPRGAKNDPTNLNKNFPVNVTRLWLKK